MKHMKAILAIVILTGAISAAPANDPPVWECFKVQSLERVDNTHYRQVSQNTCPYEIKTVFVLVKFFDKDWNRIGVHYFGAGYVAPGERLQTIIEAPDYVRGFAHVGVRKITPDALEVK